MKLTREQVLHIAKYARIHFSDEEADRLIPDLNSILEMIKTLDEVDTTGIEEIDQITGLENVFDEDEVKQFQATEELVDSSPLGKKDNMIQVKKSI